MDLLRKYAIPFKGLSAGKHRYEFDVDDRFFAAFEGSEIGQGRVHAETELEKSGSMLQLQTSIRGEVTVDCDRCLEACTLPVSFDGRLVVRFSDETDEYDGEVMFLPPGESELNLAQYIYESISLSLPFPRVHADGPDGKPDCDSDMLSRFRIVSAEEFDRMAAATETKTLGEEEAGKLQKLKESMK